MKHTFLTFTLLAMMTPVAMPADDISLSSCPPASGSPLILTLSQRKSGRNFSSTPLSPSLLSQLLWAANGINRPDGHRTAPTGLNVQDIDIYVMLESGIYLYDAPKSILKCIQTGDFRKLAGKQDFTHIAPVNLFYVQNLNRAMKGDMATQARHGGIHTGAIMQNVYLFCADAGLITVARDWLDRPELEKLLRLSPEQKIILGQTVGYGK